jgi:hypothetical protein
MVCLRCSTPALLLHSLLWDFWGLPHLFCVPVYSYLGSCCACAAFFWDFVHFMQLLAISLLSFYRPDRRYLLLDTHSYTTMLAFANQHLHSPLAIHTYKAVLALRYLHLTCLWVAVAIPPCSPFSMHTFGYPRQYAFWYPHLSLFIKLSVSEAFTHPLLVHHTQTFGTSHTYTSGSRHRVPASTCIYIYAHPYTHSPFRYLPSIRTACIALKDYMDASKACI